MAKEKALNDKSFFIAEENWDDTKFPFFGRQLDISAGHLDYNKTELGIDFDDTSRYDENDMIGVIAQINHDWKTGTNLRPHVHWIQNQNEIPNALIKYRIYDNGEAVGSWILVKWESLAFTYVSGSILQIMKFPEIDMSSISGVSSFVDIKLFRDTANTSTLFAGVDPYSGDVLMKEFDFHYQRNSLGSNTEYVKSFNMD